MVRDPLERRTDPRTPAHLPIMLRVEGVPEATPAHLVNLSHGGAALLTTSYNSPELGQYLDLSFSPKTNDEDGEPAESRNETAVVVNMAEPERGITRIGVRFIQRHGFGANMFDPIDVLSHHRRSAPSETIVNRWDTARNFNLYKDKLRKESVGNA